MLEDPEQKIARPRQTYTGYPERNVIPVEKRGVQALAVGR
jgi:citrate synthase